MNFNRVNQKDKNRIKISIIILGGKRERMFKKCLESLEGSLKKYSFPHKVEFIILSENISENIKEFIKSLNLNLRLFELEKGVKSELRNYAVKKAEGEIIYFLDDDVYVEDEFISRVAEKFERFKNVSAIGGANLTPPGSGRLEEAQGLLLSCGWGAAGMSRRYRTCSSDIETGEQSFALCNLGFRKKALEQGPFLFDERLNYNEENDLLSRMECAGHKMLFTDIGVYHYRRKTFKKFM